MSQTDFNSNSKGTNESKNKNAVFNILEKFKSFRRTAEYNEKKLEEARIVIDRLKDEINISRDIEKNVRSQFQVSQERLIRIQKNLNELITVAEKQHQNEEASQKLEEKINEVIKVLVEMRLKSENIFGVISNEIDLTKRNNELQLTISSKEKDINAIKEELKLVTKQNTEAETQYKLKIDNLTDELERTKFELAESKTKHENSLRKFKAEIEDYQQTIKEYEKERQSLLEEFECAKGDENAEECSDNFTWADSTVSIHPEGSFATASNSDNIPEKTKRNHEMVKPANEKWDFDIFQCFPTPKTNLKIKKKTSTQTKVKCDRNGKQKPVLDFLTPSQTEEIQRSPSIPTKKRLFSTNCNHYLD